MVMIEWTAPMLKRFRVAYKEALAANANSFTFDGNEFLVAYARLLIEYLETCVG